MSMYFTFMQKVTNPFQLIKSGSGIVECDTAEGEALFLLVEASDKKSAFDFVQKKFGRVAVSGHVFNRRNWRYLYNGMATTKKLVLTGFIRQILPFSNNDNEELIEVFKKVVSPSVKAISAAQTESLSNFTDQIQYIFEDQFGVAIAHHKVFKTKSVLKSLICFESTDLLP